jgi:hypothetical protein
MTRSPARHEPTPLFTTSLCHERKNTAIFACISRNLLTPGASAWRKSGKGKGYKDVKMKGHEDPKTIIFNDTFAVFLLTESRCSHEPWQKMKTTKVKEAKKKKKN